jgi:1-deoxy-D-xylulose 5-phosphate reductoisomerase
LEQKFSDGLNNLESLLAQDGYARKQARDYINGLAK